MDDTIKSFKDSFEQLRQSFSLGMGIWTWVIAEHLEDDMIKVKNSMDWMGKALEDKGIILYHMIINYHVSECAVTASYIMHIHTPLQSLTEHRKLLETLGLVKAENVGWDAGHGCLA